MWYGLIVEADVNDARGFSSWGSGNAAPVMRVHDGKPQAQASGSDLDALMLESTTAKTSYIVALALAAVNLPICLIESVTEKAVIPQK